MTTTTHIPSTSAEWAALSLAEAKGREAARAATLRAFVAHAQAVRADFTVEIRTHDQLTAVLTTIGGHNDFDPAATAAALGPLIGDAMGVRVRSYVGGPSIDIDIPWFDGHRLVHLGTGSMGNKLTVENREIIAQRFIDAAIEQNADLVGMTQGVGESAKVVHRRVGDNPHTLTLWWD